MTGEDRLRLLLVLPGENELRIRFKDGEVFVLRYITEVIEWDEALEKRSSAAESWSGQIVEFYGVAPEHAEFFRAGSRIDFKASDIQEVTDEMTSRVLWSAS